jgi:hypothetical protein
MVGPKVFWWRVGQHPGLSPLRMANGSGAARRVEDCCRPCADPFERGGFGTVRGTVQYLYSRCLLVAPCALTKIDNRAAMGSGLRGQCPSGGGACWWRALPRTCSGRPIQDETHTVIATSPDSRALGRPAKSTPQDVSHLQDGGGG